MPDLKTDQSPRSTTGNTRSITALALAVIALLLSGITMIGTSTGFFPLKVIQAAGVPSTVQVVDTVDINAVEEIEVVVFALIPPEQLTVRVRVLGTGVGRVAKPGTTTFDRQAEDQVTVVDLDGTSVRFPIQSSAAGDTTYAIEVVKTNGGTRHDRRSLTVRFADPSATPTPATPTPPGGGTPPTP
jgi:hypothetical protein